MSSRLTLVSTLLGALSIIIAFAYSQSPPLALTAQDTGPRHYTVDKPECVVDDAGTPAPTSRTGLASPDSVVNRAINCPDQFAWMQWARINAAADGEHPTWIYWATDNSTFPVNPQPSECSGTDEDDPEHCPYFGPTATAPVDRDAGQPVALQLNLPSKRPYPLHTPASRARAEAMDAGEVPKNLDSVTKETIHRHRASFDYIVEPHAVRDSAYAPGELRPYLEKTMLANVPQVLRKNYRLKGTQTQYILSTGEPTLLGNSVTEHGFVQTSSCMTCHARASSDWQGRTPYFFGGTSIGQSFNGAPDPEWFFGTNNQAQTFMSPADFVWAVSRARPIGGGYSAAERAFGASSDKECKIQSGASPAPSDQ